MTLYCGIDLHSSNSVLSIIDKEDNVIFEQRIANDLDLILERLKPYQDKLFACVVESTYNWYWLVDGLQAAGYEVRLANTNAMRQYDGIKHTNDFTDARYLAHLLRLNILPEGYIYPIEKRSLRDALRRRQLLVKQRTVIHISLQSHITRLTGRRLTTSQMRTLTEERLTELLANTQDKETPCIQLSVYQELTKAVTAIERSVLAKVKTTQSFELLNTVPGIGSILALTILLESGDMQRFPKVGNYASYARCVNSEKLSNGKRKGQGNKKNGNRYLAWAFIEAAHFAAIWSPTIKRYYQRKKDTKHVMVAKKAVANKLARACFHMLRTETPFDIKRAFG